MHPSRNYDSAGQSANAGRDCTAEPPYRNHTGLGAATISKGPEIPALESIGNRIQNLAVRLDDTNRNTLTFVERVSGAEPARPEPAPVSADLGAQTPALTIISMLLDRLEYHVMMADNLSRKLARIG